MATRTGVLVGAAARLTYDVTSMIEAGLRVGYHHGATEGADRSQLTVATIVGTSRFFLTAPGEGLFLGTSIGLSQSSWRTERATKAGSTSKSGIWSDAGVGWVYSRELPFEIAMRVSVLDLSAAERAAVGVTFTAGYQVQF